MLLLLTVFLPHAGGAWAGTLSGTVLSVETRGPVADVVVTAISPSLTGEQVVVTDAQGRYRLTGLPPGVYTLRFEKDYFAPYAVTDTPLRPGVSLRINVELVPSEEGYEIEHIGPCRATLLDFTGSTTGMEVESEFRASLPANRPGDRASALRTAEGLAPWVPGITEGLEGFSVHGASPYENAYLLDGLSTRDAATGLNALPVSQELLEYAHVLTAGYLPELGRTSGGILDVQTRDGTHDLGGFAFAHWAPGPLEGSRRGGPERGALRNLGDFGAALGGSLPGRRLRFFVGVTPALGRVEAPGASFSDSRGLQALGRLAYPFHPHHEVALSVLTSPQSLREAGGTLERNTTRVALHQASTFQDGHLLLDVDAGWLGQRDSPGDGVLLERALDQYQARARLSWLRKGGLGYHRVQAGVDVEHFVHARTRAPDALESRTPGTVLGGYVQDQWTTLANQVTVHGGLRYDVQLLDAGGSRVTLPLLSPRVGVVFDPGAQERTKLFVHYARYPGLVPLGLLDRATVDERLPVQGPSRIDPDLEAMASHEAVAGVARNIGYQADVSVTYTRRVLDSGLASLRTDSPGSVVLVNPGAGLGAGLPRAERTHDAVTLQFLRAFSDGWLGHVSYTGSRLRGNHAGPWDGVAGTSGPPPGDRPHVLRIYGAREVHFNPSVSLRGGLSYLSGSGMPVADGTSRTPWLHTVDARLMLSWRLSRAKVVSFNLDAFNVFNFQAATQLEARDSGLVPVRYQPPRQVRLGVRYNF
jgi:hypothetical protein